jgi:serine/threonine protein kinase
MALSSGARLGPYEILAAIGVGGKGEVYRARDTRLDRSAAIKVLPAQVSADPDSRARFGGEAGDGVTHRASGRPKAIPPSL